MPNFIDSFDNALRSCALCILPKFKRLTLHWLAIVAVLLVWPAVGRAGSISLGYLSWDVLIPGAPGSPGINTFTIGNFTGDPALGGNDLPPTFPVLTSLRFMNSSLMFIADGSQRTLLLGDIGPGFYDSPLLVFPDTVQMASALFSATIDSTVLTLDGGGVFVASSNQISALLRPSSGSNLVAGTDFQSIDVPSSPAAVPEPGTYPLLLTGFLAVLSCCHGHWQPNR